MDPEISAESELSPEEKIDAIVDSIPDEEVTEEASSPEKVTAEDTDQTTDEDVETVVTDPEAPVITPPDSWTAEAREKFNSLPPDLQAVIVDREREQKSTFNRQINEVAEQRKAIETERQRYAQGLDYFANNIQMDPILAEGQKTDWARLAQEDPVAYVEKKAAFDQRVQQVNQVMQERAYLQQQEYQTTLQREAQALSDIVPEWKDPKIQNEMIEVGKKYKFSPEETKSFMDHRFIHALRDLDKYHKLVAAQSKVQAKKVVPVVKVQKPGGGEASPKDNTKALKQRLANASGMHDRAAMIAAMIED